MRRRDSESGQRLWGLFDGASLVGVATTSYETGLDLGWLRDVFVIPSCRGKDYGRRPVLTGFGLKGAGLYSF